VVKFDKENDSKGWLLVDTKLPLDGSLIGRQIIIETAGKRDASYKIRDVQREGDLTKVLCGNISFISSIKNKAREKNNSNVLSQVNSEYLYDFREGDTFKIASYAIWKEGK
jgi:hypothetical protein